MQLNYISTKIKHFDDDMKRNNRDVLSWLMDYVVRNHIVWDIDDDPTQLDVYFRSTRQFDCFIRIAKRTWKDFEFTIKQRRVKDYWEQEPYSYF